MSDSLSDHTMEQTLDELRAKELLLSRGYRVLSPFVGKPWGAPIVRAGDADDLRTGLLIDTESTGPDPLVDEIIQLAMVPFLYVASSGRILEVMPALTWLEEPSREISAEASAVHGLTLEDVRGLHMPADEVVALWDQADIVVAHNAPFDRTLFRRRFPDFPAKPWGCSYRDVPWRRAGYSSGALGSLLSEHTQQHFHGHDAARDCYATLACLSAPFLSPHFTELDWYPLYHVLREINAERVRVWANGAAFHTKDTLKARGYQWYDPTSQRGVPVQNLGRKAWYRDLPASAQADELAWLTQTIYLQDASRYVLLQPLSNLDRFDR